MPRAVWLTKKTLALLSGRKSGRYGYGQIEFFDFDKETMAAINRGIKELPPNTKFMPSLKYLKEAQREYKCHKSV